MKKHTVSKTQVTLFEKHRIDLDYSLILTDRKEFDIIDDDTVYSILILQNEGGITTEYDFLYDIARNKQEAVAILDMLVYNNVMPSNARDVLADIL